jgi:hypothetical protein
VKVVRRRVLEGQRAQPTVAETMRMSRPSANAWLTRDRDLI